MKPFAIRDAKEIRWIKDWFRNQALSGRLNAIEGRLRLISTQEDLQRLIDQELDIDGRMRLQKALSARRRREQSPRNTVTTELERYARNVLLAAQVRQLEI